MTTPLGPGWYDDPDGSPDAERRWDGQNWTPERRRKPTQRAPRPPVAPYSAPTLTQPAYEYPTGPAEAPIPLQPAWTPAANLRRPLGWHDMIAIALGLCGIALMATVFMEWGRAREIVSVRGDAAVARLSFPGVGDVRVSFSSSNVVGEIRNIDGPPNTNAGWPAILFGVLVIMTAVAYWQLNKRLALAIAAIVLGSIAITVFVYQLTDLRRVFGDQPDFGDADFSPGLGLLGACVLAFAIVGIGITALVRERRERQTWVETWPQPPN